MKVPKFLYGTYPEVKKNCRAVVKLLFKKYSWDNFTFQDLSQGECIDTNSIKGMIYLDAPSPRWRDAQFIYPGLFSEEMMKYRDKLHRENPNEGSVECLFDICLLEPWSMLLLLSLNTYQWIIFDKKKYFSVLCDFWHIFDSVGEKFGPARKEPTTLWKTQNLSHRILFSLGVSREELMSDLPGGHIRNLLEAHHLI
ncbi:MAG: hypothetical protein JW969_01665 [Spirochaetales bacterium]|nr:hypothetical protein [Spirochaetales bacterium]